MLNSDGLRLSLHDALRLDELKKGIFHFRHEIDTCNVEDFLLELKDVRAHPEHYKEITIRLTSPGGNAYHAFGLYAVLRELSFRNVHVKVIVEGMAASAAAMIVLQAADERLALLESSFLLHEPKRWIFFAYESKSDLEDEVTEMKRITDKIVEILSFRCKKSRDEVNKLIERKEVWMSVEDALKWNLIDAIIGPMINDK